MKKIEKMKVILSLTVLSISIALFAGCTGSEGIPQSVNMPEKVGEVKK